MTDVPLDPESEEPEKPKKKPLARRLYEGTEAMLGPAAPALAPTLFVLGWAYVNFLFGSPDPEHGYGLAWLAPSPDATAFFAIAAVWMAALKKPPRVLAAIFTVVLFPAWWLRLVDRLTLATFDRPFHVADATEVWELLILLDDTVDRFTIILWCSFSGVVVCLLFWLAHQALSHAGTFFERWPSRIAFAVVAGLLVIAHLATGSVFAESLVARAFEELGGSDEDREAELAAALAVLGEGHDLAGLREADVYVLVVPRYAQLLRDDPRFAPQLRARWAAFEQALGEARYDVRSTLLAPSDRVGFVAYETATLATGATVRDRAGLDLVLARGAPSLGARYREAGYRSVYVLPGETRERPERELSGFDLTYHSWELGYLGPTFGRSPMPDQYVLALIRDRELWETEPPLFALFELSSSMPPFSPLPPYHEQWFEVGRGDGYRTPPPPPPSHSFFELDQAADDYRASILYVLDVIEGYLTVAIDEAPPEGRGRESRRARRRRPAPLFVVVGDRAPLRALAGVDAARGVIAHAISRRGSHLEPFADAGWTEGVVPEAEHAEVGHVALTAILTRGMSSEPE